MSAVCAACSGSTWHRDGCRFEDTISDGFGSVPRRVQLSRAKGWRKPENTVVASRPSRWGNPYVVGSEHHAGPAFSGRTFTVRDAAHAVALYRRWMFHKRRAEDLVVELRGKNLACWCPLDQPCHADVLLELILRGEGWSCDTHVRYVPPEVWARVRAWMRTGRRAGQAPEGGSVSEPTSPALPAGEAPGAPQGPVGSLSAPNPQIALHRPEQENP